MRSARPGFASVIFSTWTWSKFHGQTCWPFSDVESLGPSRKRNSAPSKMTRAPVAAWHCRRSCRSRGSTRPTTRLQPRGGAERRVGREVRRCVVGRLPWSKKVKKDPMTSTGSGRHPLEQVNGGERGTRRRRFPLDYFPPKAVTRAPGDGWVGGVLGGRAGHAAISEICDRGHHWNLFKICL